MYQLNITLVYLSYFLCSFVSFAQDSPESFQENEITLDVGYNKTYFKDLNFSPLNYKGGGLNVALGYQRKTRNKNQINTKFEFSQSLLKSRASNKFNTERNCLDFTLGYSALIPTKGDKSNLLLGLAYRSRIDFQQFLNVNAISFFGLHGLDINAKYGYEIAKNHQLEASLSIPIFGLLSRPPYTGWDKYIIDSENNISRIFFRGKWGSLNAFQVFNFGSNYRFKFSDHWTLKLGYQFNFSRTAHLDKVIIVSNNINTGISFNF